MYKIGLIPGDGIGDEIAIVAKAVIEATGVAMSWEEASAGERAEREWGSPVPKAVFDMIERSDAVLKGPIGTPIGKGFKSVNVSLRQALSLSTNIRPVKSIKGYGKFENVDMVIFRENSEDLYLGIEKVIDENEVHAIKKITRQASTAIGEAAFAYAKKNGRKKVTAVHKANIMKQSDGLFLESIRGVAKGYLDIAYEEVIVDNMCMQMVVRPEQFDVIVTENLYGDILSDLAAGLVGGLGLVPSGNFGRRVSIFEAVHGSAPDIAGKGIANPIGLILSGAMMLRHLGETSAAERIEEAIKQVLEGADQRILTPDLGGEGTTETLGNAIIEALKKG